MTKRTKWYSGPPPSVGWWPASCIEDKKTLRWWNGKTWSFPAYTALSRRTAAYTAQFATSVPAGEIKWTKRWWE